MHPCRMEQIDSVKINPSLVMMRECKIFQGSRFLKFVLEAARLHFAEENFEKLSVPQRFGPTFMTTTFVSVEI